MMAHTTTRNLLVLLLVLFVLVCLVVAKQEEVTVEDVSEAQQHQQHTTPTTAPETKTTKQQPTSPTSTQQLFRKRFAPLMSRPFQIMKHYMDRLADFERTFFDSWNHPLLGGDDEDDVIADKEEAERSSAIQPKQDDEDNWWPSLSNNLFDTDSKLWNFPFKKMNQLLKREGWGMKEAKFDEQDNAYVVTMPLPGIDKDDIKIELVEPPKREGEGEEEEWDEDEYAPSRFRKQLRKLIIKVNHREVTKDENGKGEKVVTRHNTYVLPKKVEAAKLNAQYKNGLLTVTVPKVVVSEEQRKKKKLEPIVHSVAIQ